MPSSKKKSGVGNILVAQLLLGAVIYVALTFYPAQPKVAMVVIYLLVVGMLYFSWKGLKGLWK